MVFVVVDRLSWGLRLGLGFVPSFPPVGGNFEGDLLLNFSILSLKLILVGKVGLVGFFSSSCFGVGLSLYSTRYLSILSEFRN